MLYCAGCATNQTASDGMRESFERKFGEAYLDKLDPPPPGVFDVTQLDKRPSPTKEVPPMYPRELRRRGITGEAVVIVIVDEKGTPERLAIYRATEPGFAAAAATCIAKWTFTPGIREGHPVRCRLSVPIKFDLD